MLQQLSPFYQFDRNIWVKKNFNCEQKWVALFACCLWLIASCHHCHTQYHGDIAWTAMQVFLFLFDWFLHRQFWKKHFLWVFFYFKWKAISPKKRGNFTEKIIKTFIFFAELARCENCATMNLEHSTYLALNENFMHPDNFSVYSLSKKQIKFRLTSNIGSRMKLHPSFLDFGRCYLKVHLYELLHLVIKLFVI